MPGIRKAPQPRPHPMLVVAPSPPSCCLTDLTSGHLLPAAMPAPVQGRGCPGPPRSSSRSTWSMSRELCAVASPDGPQASTEQN